MENFWASSIVLAAALWTSTVSTLGESKSPVTDDPWFSLDFTWTDDAATADLSRDTLWWNKNDTDTRLVIRNMESSNTLTTNLSALQIAGLQSKSIIDANESYPLWNETTQLPDLNAPAVMDNTPPFNGSIWYNNQTLYNDTLVPNDLPSLVYCVCNCSFVSYDCCNAPIVHESTVASNNKGVLRGCISDEGITSHNVTSNDDTSSWTVESSSTDTSLRSSTSTSSEPPTQISFGIVQVGTIAPYHAGQGIPIAALTKRGLSASTVPSGSLGGSLASS